MSLMQTHERLQLPDTLQRQLLEFRRRVWLIKSIEVITGAIFGVLAAFFLVFALDRFWDTPQSIRLVIFIASLGICALVPVYFHRWIWRQRRLEQLARLLSHKLPHIGDHLLGVIELVQSESEQARSRRLCEAAIVQVAQQAEEVDFRRATPDARHREWAWLAAAVVVLAVVVGLALPTATRNAWTRFLAPWSDTPRYTFADVQRLPDRLVVAHGEPFTFAVQLNNGSMWQPAQAKARLGSQQTVVATLKNGRYEFSMPPQIDSSRLRLKIGDWDQTLRVQPMLRPELTSLTANVSLPEYIGRPEPLKKDVRGGALSIVKGSTVDFTATANRNLASGSVDGTSQKIKGATLQSSTVNVSDVKKVQFEWRDEYGLSGKEPFTLTLTSREDEAPTLTCEDLPRQRVVLDSEALNFKVRAQDDYGIQRIGMEWQGIQDATVGTPAKGEKILSAGGHDKETLDITGTFSAVSLGIEAQPLQVRLWTEDYYPGRERVYTAPYVLYILTPEQHAVWLTEQLSKWHRQSLDVRDRELQLYETNKQLRELTPEQLDDPATRKRIEDQASGERANGRRLTNLTAAGEELIRQASRNPEFGVGHLEKWAEMLQILKDISSNRMPSVSDLLKEAAKAPSLAKNSPSQKNPIAGQIRANTSGQGEQSKSDDQKQTPKPPVPQIVDVESTQQKQKPSEQQNSNPNQSNSSPSLTLPTTSLVGGVKPSNQACPVQQKMDEAVRKQQDLLAEFEKIADELNRVLANLEGSTLVKRLKAASRLQYKIGGRLGDKVDSSFGVASFRLDEDNQHMIKELSDQEDKGCHDVSNIMDDMASYFERRRFVQFKTVLEEMRNQDVVGSLRQLGDDFDNESGMSIAQCEYWSDTLDRWAEDLVDPASGGT